jgi:hypothetical protein
MMIEVRDATASDAGTTATLWNARTQDAGSC